MPTADELAALYPGAAGARGLGGRAVIKCKIKRDGRLTGCTIIQETPLDMGFGTATLRATRYFKLRPTRSDGTPVEGGTIIIPLNWQTR